MALKTLTFTFAGEEEVINDLRNSFVAYHGWTQESGITRRRAMRDALWNYVVSCAADYDATLQGAAAQQAAKAAAKAKGDQVTRDDGES